MSWTIVNAVERHLFTAVFTAVAVLICAGLSYWIWLDRANRSVPEANELVQVHGIASSPQHRNRAHSIWFHFEPDVAQVEGFPAPKQLQVQGPDLAAIQAALEGGPVPVVASLVRTELGRGEREEPPCALRLRTGDRTLLPLSVGRELRAERVAQAVFSAWIAAAGIAVALIALAVHWMSKLRA